jgi:hypothetical protein
MAVRSRLGSPQRLERRLERFAYFGHTHTGFRGDFEVFSVIMLLQD